MRLIKPGPDRAPYGLRAVTMIARAAEGGLARPQRAMLDAAQRVVLDTALDVETLLPITAEELATHFDQPALARQLVRGMVAMSLAQGRPTKEQVALISAFATALGVEEPAVKVVGHLMQRQMFRFRVGFMRHSHLRSYLRNTYRAVGGILPMIKALLVARGVIAEDTSNASRFRALAELPEDTLGYQFYRHYTENGLAFPGEKSGFPVGALFHDFSHVLSGYDTSPEGELKNAAFQTGFTRDEDAFFTVLFAILIHTAGVNMAPFEMPVLRGRIGQGDLAVEILRGFERGSAMKVDLSDDWDFWDYVEMPIAAARERLGVAPIGGSA